MENVQIQEINITQLPRATVDKPINYCACLDGSVVPTIELDELKTQIKNLSIQNASQNSILENLAFDLDSQEKAYEKLINKLSNIFDELESNLSIQEFHKVLKSSVTLDDLFLDINKSCFVKGEE